MGWALCKKDIHKWKERNKDSVLDINMYSCGCVPGINTYIMQPFCNNISNHPFYIVSF